ncbi:Two-component sensor signal transduction histidine kinase [Tenacibaculum litopenaei]|uniref:sensor histidine kinase n=1 Tax=Tenacibaculum litopenaei TaxID=396016 RepID=UPI0038958F8A
MGTKHYIQLTIRLLLFSVNSVAVYMSIRYNYLINSIVFVLVLLFQAYLIIDYVKNVLLEVEKSIDCLLHNDYSNTISSAKRNVPLYNKTALLQEKYRKQSLRKSSEELIFVNIIESLSIGLLILRRDRNHTIEVFQLNNAFINFLQIPKMYKWSLLKTRLGKLNEFLEEWREFKHTITLKINKKEETFFIKSSITTTNSYEYCVISLETIQQLIDKKEKEAWYKLMNVMSHEIINTITPISSLAENLYSILQDDPEDEDTVEELAHGLQVIKRRSSHLTSFVDTYRKLAELPLPAKEQIDLNQLITNTLSLFQGDFENNAIKVTVQIPDNSTVLADKNQLEQVIINIISNCIYALSEVNEPLITIQIVHERYRTHIHITDNGIGISEEIKANVFVPYFTTRKDGSGIGLTLSKSIIEAHNGSIHFVSSKGKTTFTLSLYT